MIAWAATPNASYAFASIPFMEYDVVFPSIFVNFFNTCLQGGWFFIRCPLLRFLSWLFVSCEGLFFWFVRVVCLCEEKLFFVSDIRGRGRHLNGRCVDIFPGFETYPLRDFKFKSGKKVGCSVDWSSNVCYFKVKLQHIITSIPECWWDCFVWKKLVTDLLSVKEFVGFVASHKMCANSRNAI